MVMLWAGPGPCSKGRPAPGQLLHCRNIARFAEELLKSFCWKKKTLLMQLVSQPSAWPSLHNVSMHSTLGAAGLCTGVCRLEVPSRVKLVH